MGKRCQVCDGPIVNGKCKYCGMPYRNDMELYHLNEDRSEHYRHASAKEKKAMAESEIPLPDRNKTAQKSAKTAAAGKAKKVSGTYSTGKKTRQEKKKKGGRAGKIFWIIVLLLMVSAGQISDHWDSIGHRIEEFVYDTFDIDPGSIFGDGSAEETEENDWQNNWEEIIGTAKNSQNEQRENPDWCMSPGEKYIVGDADTDSDSQEYDYTIDPGEYRVESGWEAIALEIRSASGKEKTVKFDEAGAQEKIELHTGDQVSVVSLDGQENYLAIYQIQQYDE